MGDTKEEYYYIMKNNTLELIEFLKDKVTIGSNLLFKTKFYVDKTIDKYKAKLIEKCYSSKQGIDYEEWFVATAKMNAVWMLIAMATKHNWKLN